MNKTFKASELRNELRNEKPNNWAITINGELWKIVASRKHAEAIVRTLTIKGGKRVGFFETAASVYN